MKWKNLAIGFLHALLWVTPALRATPVAPDAYVQVQRLGRGINVLSDDPIWDDPSKARFQSRFYRVIRDGGFQTLRVNLHAFRHMDAANRLDPPWLSTLDDVVRQATQAGLNVILDEHDFEACAADAASCRVKLLAFWQQVAPHYRNAPSSILFEILNEPGGQLTPTAWNGMLVDNLAAIRRSNPDRSVVIGPANGNYFQALDSLRLPQSDPHIVVAVHYYNPFRFTHQGASWVRSDIREGVGIRWGSDADRKQLFHEFDAIAAWSTAHHRPILLGEFGTYDTVAMPDRVAWTMAVMHAAEKRDFAWCYWQFASDFNAYDIGADHWVAPSTTR